ncbi:hypothetical protein KAFR_0G00380 [Kazachstania africana CBS 2517]|uniref:Zinc/iron permease n=1 Tax=Kazachstania africana (strain ATCC 22294 / BCRC 22015 / CBS 2517 / CECT 1963 / NBRC 1671 / NRRL Y-8276) TaxID=1071382 RepID=H2AXH1_KAZAF|nr:hypothetical protein KAFR_0G00380 [Kazachstania africana CBS 2517]CCF59071.1 hypothetical protein KAFR_0G00380 [Kazachstania africana CBS 2517]
MQSDMPKWLLYSLISSFLCILGSFCVPLLSSFTSKDSRSNTKLLNYGLSLSAGSMITTALYKMLPRTTDENRYTVFCGVVLGISISLGLNYIVHAFASESLIHCAHDANEHSDGHDDHHSAHKRTVVVDADTTGVYNSMSAVTETEPLLRAKSLKTKKSLIDIISHRHVNGSCCTNNDLVKCCQAMKVDHVSCIPPEMSPITDNDVICTIPATVAAAETATNDNDAYGILCMENSIGYDLENLSLYRKNFLNSKLAVESDSLTSSDNGPDETLHHHHLETPFSKLLSIGMQTCLVLTLHKFPEGLIIYYTNHNEENSALGFSIFLSLTIHNFVEGFAMTLPFSSIFESKWLAILITVVLGGGSQPLGALIGYLIFRNKAVDGDNLPHMDLLLSVTAGFLLVISLQMFQTGIGFSDSHHHHSSDINSHSLGTNCLKWCCFGVLLILASNTLKL